MTQASIIDLADPACTDPGVVGGKAAELARLRADGYPVPDGVVLPASLLAGWVPNEECPDHVRSAIETAINRLGGVAVAVRSSADSEDGSSASYAGSFTTVLGVHGVDDAVDAVRTCLDSAGADRVAAYRGGGGVGMSVLIQPMLTPSAAGVAFTLDPVTGETESVVISAAAGLGDQVADGTADPEEWRVPEAETPSVSHRNGALTEEQARDVAELARRIAAQRGGPQDMEWAIEDDRTWVLQSRPITIIPIPPSEKLDGTGWEKDEGHYPELVTPFGWSVFGPAVVSAFTEVCDEFGLMIAGVDQVSIGGEVYIRPTPPIGSAEASEKVPPPWALGAAVRLVPSLRRRMKTARRVLTDGLPDQLIDRWHSEWKAEFTERTQTMLAEDLTALDDEGLVDHYRRARRLLDDGHSVHFRLVLPYSLDLHEFVTVCHELLGWEAHQALAMLAGSSPASIAGVDALDEIRRRIVGRTELVEALRSAPVDPVAALVPVDPALADELRNWLQVHGWRPLNYDPGSVAVAERPGIVTQILLQPDEPGNGVAASEAEDEASTRLKGADLERFRSVLAKARRAYPVREDNVILTDNVPSGILRRWVLEAGRRLVERRLLGRVDDVVFCLGDELEGVLSGDTELDLRPIVTRRRGEQAWVKAHPGPVVVGASGPMPDLRYLPEHGRRMNEALFWAITMEFPGELEVVDGADLQGIPAASGRYTGRVRVVRGESDFATLLPGEVLVCTTTSPAWTILFGTAGALVTDGGGPLAHAAIVAREHGLPAVVGTGSATSRLRDGQLVTVDGTAGTVTIHEEA